MRVLLTCLAGFALALFCSSDLFSQEFSWVRLGVNEQGAASSQTVVTDEAGNVYIGGYIGIESRFDDLLLATGGYLVKYDVDGTVQWGQSFPSQDVRDIAVDDQHQSIYIVGLKNGDITASRYDMNGRLYWSRSISAESNFAPRAYSASVDKEGNLYVTGMVDYAAYIAKYDIAGTQLWSKSLTWTWKGENLFWEAFSATPDALGNLYVLIGLGDNGPAMRLVKLNNAGDVLWERTDSGSLGPVKILEDGAGHLYAAATLWRKATFDGVPFQTPAMSNLIVKLDTSGAFLGAVQIDSSRTTKVNDIALDAQGDVFAVGTAINHLTVGSSSVDVGPQEAFVVQLDSDLNFRRMSVTGALSQGLNVTAKGTDVYLTGLIFPHEPTFGGLILNPHGGGVFFAKLEGTSSVQDPREEVYNVEAVLSPNPVLSAATLSSQYTRIDRMELYDVAGRPVRTYAGPIFGGQKISLNFEGLPSGTYYLHIQGEEGRSVVTVSR